MGTGKQYQVSLSFQSLWLLLGCSSWLCGELVWRQTLAQCLPGSRGSPLMLGEATYKCWDKINCGAAEMWAKGVYGVHLPPAQRRCISEGWSVIQDPLTQQYEGVFWWLAGKMVVEIWDCRIDLPQPHWCGMVWNWRHSFIRRVFA